MAGKLSPIDNAARLSRHHLLVALALMLLLGTTALLGFTSPELAQKGKALWMIMPLVITILVGVLSWKGKRVDQRSMNAVRNDELRQACLQRACRNGFLVALAVQPILVLALSRMAVTHETVVMAVATVTASSVTVLASLLWYDR